MRYSSSVTGRTALEPAMLLNPRLVVFSVIPVPILESRRCHQRCSILCSLLKLISTEEWEQEWTVFSVHSGPPKASVFSLFHSQRMRLQVLTLPARIHPSFFSLAPRMENAAGISCGMDLLSTAVEMKGYQPLSRFSTRRLLG